MNVSVPRCGPALGRRPGRHDPSGAAEHGEHRIEVRLAGEAVRELDGATLDVVSSRIATVAGTVEVPPEAASR